MGKRISPFDLSSYSQLINVAGTSPTTTDLRGKSVIGAQREWGALEYDSSLSINYTPKYILPFDLASYSTLLNVAGTSPTTTDIRGTSVIGTQREWGALEYNATLTFLFMVVLSIASDGLSTPVISKLNRKRPFAIGGVTASAGTSLITNIKKVFAITSTAVANTLFEFTTYISVIYKQFVVSSDITSTTSLAFNMKKVFSISSAIVSTAALTRLNRIRSLVFGSVTGSSTGVLNKIIKRLGFILSAESISSTTLTRIIKRVGLLVSSSAVTSTTLEWFIKVMTRFLLISTTIADVTISRLNIKKVVLLVSDITSSTFLNALSFKKIFSLISDAVSTAIIYNYWLPGSMEYYNMRKNLKVAIIKLKRI